MGGRPIRFADVVIDPGTREVRRGSEVVPVQKRVFELLAYLIENRDRAVGKDELQERIWPGMIVTETALTRAVMKARRAVGDDPTRQAVIRTVHGHGYRFVASLEPDSGDAVAAKPVPPRSRRSNTAWGAVGTIALLGLVAAAALLSFNSGNAGGIRIAVLPVVDRTGDPDLGWAALGLMSYANRLFAEGVAGDTVPARSVMAQAESVPDDPDTASLQDLRKSLGASHLVRGILSRQGDRLTLEYRVVHEQGGGPAASVSGTQPTELAREMTQSVISSLPGSGLRRDFRTVSGDPFVNEAYARGLALQLKGEVARARDYFSVAVSQEPDLFWPRYELALTMRDMGELDAARENLEALAASTARSPDMEMRAAANNALAQVFWRQREYARADQAYQTAFEAALASGEPELQATILVNRPRAHYRGPGGRAPPPGRGAGSQRPGGCPGPGQHLPVPWPGGVGGGGVAAGSRLLPARARRVPDGRRPARAGRVAQCHGQGRTPHGPIRKGRRAHAGGAGGTRGHR